MDKETVSNALLALITERNISYGELSKRTGIPKSALQRYATGQTTKIPIDRVEKIAEALSGSVLDLMGWNEPEITEDYVTFNIIGEVAAGYGREAYTDDYGTIDMPKSWLHGRPKSDYFVLKIKGDSMFPTYQDGDLILVLKQSTLNYSGQVGVVSYEDDRATLKRIEYVMGEDWMRLVPINPNYPPEMVRDEALEHCHVLGLPKMVIREIS